MTQTQLADAVADKAGLSRADAKKALAALEEVVLDEIGNAEKIKIGGVVQLDVRVRPATVARPGPEPCNRRGDHDLREAGLGRRQGSPAREGEERGSAALEGSEQVTRTSAGRVRPLRTRPASLCACGSRRRRSSRRAARSSTASAGHSDVGRRRARDRLERLRKRDVDDEHPDARPRLVRDRRHLSLHGARAHCGDAAHDHVARPCACVDLRLPHRLELRQDDGDRERPRRNRCAAGRPAVRRRGTHITANGSLFFPVLSYEQCAATIARALTIGVNTFVQVPFTGCGPQRCGHHAAVRAQRQLRGRERRRLVSPRRARRLGHHARADAAAAGACVRPAGCACSTSRSTSSAARRRSTTASTATTTSASPRWPTSSASTCTRS